MSEAGRGLPLLSGPPPAPDSAETDKSCRKCNKDFVPLLVRHRKCNHCGYAFCHSCTDYQALMPRENGYDAMNVCGFCIEYLTITATGRTQLKAMPMSRLRNYINAYNIKTVDRIVEKDDLIDAILKARGPNGCVPLDNEAYYRRHSIPSKISPSRSRGFFSTPRQGQNTNFQASPPKPPPRPSPPEFARPDLESDNPPPPSWDSHPNASRFGEPSPQRRQQQRTQYAPSPPPQPQRPSAPREQQYQPPPPRPRSSFSYPAPPSPPPQFQPPPPNFGYGRQPSTSSSPPPPPPQFTRPTTQPTAPPPPPPSTRPRAPSTAPPPTLDQLLSMPSDSIRALSISTLKGILFTNHVNVGNVLEKGDLVSKVVALVEDEKRERDRMRLVGEMEEMERVQKVLEREGVSINPNAFSSSSSLAREGPSHQGEQAINSEGDRREHASDSITGSDEEALTEDSKTVKHEAEQPNKAKTPPTTNASMAALERSGLCVVCQDEEANIAIVDCGHMAMCKICSDLIMSSSKECPLCRTRIVTEARLLRIFKS